MPCPYITDGGIAINIMRNQETAMPCPYMIIVG